MRSRLRDGALHGALALLLLILINLLAGGSLLGGRLSAVGASFWRIALFGGPMMILGGALGALLVGLLHRFQRT